MNDRRAIVMIDDEAQLEALASTVRLDLVDTLQALGEASVPELAARLGRPADGLYYHLRALTEVGIVRVVGEQKRGRSAETVYSVEDPDGRLAIRHNSKTPRARAAVQKIVRSMLSAAEREYRQCSDTPDCVVEGPERELWPSRAVGWLSKEDLVRVNSLLVELNSLMSGQRSGPTQKLYALQFSLAPIARAPNSDLTEQP